MKIIGFDRRQRHRQRHGRGADAFARRGLGGRGCRLSHALCGEPRNAVRARYAFGGVTDANGVLDRPKLAKIVFSDPAKLQQLNEITTPYIRKASLDAIHAQSARPIVLYDAPTLFEAGADDFCDKIIAVLAPHRHPCCPNHRARRSVRRGRARPHRRAAERHVLPRKMRFYHRKQRRSRYAVSGHRCFIQSTPLSDSD